jgi:hypothetical protein
MANLELAAAEASLRGGFCDTLAYRKRQVPKREPRTAEPSDRAGDKVIETSACLSGSRRYLQLAWQRAAI